MLNWDNIYDKYHSTYQSLQRLKISDFNVGVENDFYIYIEDYYNGLLSGICLLKNQPCWFHYIDDVNYNRIFLIWKISNENYEEILRCKSLDITVDDKLYYPNDDDIIGYYVY